MKRLGAIVRSCGSLWFAAVLLMLLMVAMACATVFESTHGTERALAVFYHSRWFELLLGLLAVNVLAAVVVRYPFSRRQVGFVVTHASVLVVLGGALVTKHLGVDGQLGLVEGETASEFYDAAVSSLAASNREAGTQASVDLRRLGVVKLS